MSPHPRTTRLRPGGRMAALLVAGVALATPIALAPAASAHDAFVGSIPKAGSTLTTAPTSVTVSFEEPPLAAGLAVAVTAPDTTLVTSGDPVLTGSDVVSPLVPLTQAGVYTVAWRVVADDGHPVTGTFSFTLDLAGSGPTGSAGPSSAASPSVSLAASTEGSSSSASWIVAGLGALVLLGVGVAFAMRRRSA